MVTSSRVSFVLLVAVLVSSGPVLVAQPSGGPYGPIHQRYEIPADAKRVIHVSPEGDAQAPGTNVAAPTTLAGAIARAVTGDAIILRGGTYRTGDLKFNQGITLQPFEDERPVWKGSRIAAEWTAQPNGLWRTTWTTLFPDKPGSWWRREREGRLTPPWLFHNDLVFIDGVPLRAVGWEGEVDAGLFTIDYETRQVYIGTDPTDRLVEITAFDNAFTRTIDETHGRGPDRIGPRVRGIEFTQFGYRAIEILGREPEGPAPESEYGKDVVGSVFEHCSFTHCARAAGYFRGDKLVIRHCLVSDTSTEGIFLHNSADAVLEKNVFRRNNIEGITGYYPAAVKIFNQTHRVVCRDNLVTEQPNSNGIWYDVGNRDGIFVNNWIQDCKDGFFFEISDGATVAGNVFVNCDKGIRSLNSANVHVYQNTFVNTVASFERTPRSAVGDHFDWHPATGPDVDEREGHIFVNNLLVATDGFSRAMLRCEQTPSLCDRLTTPMVTALDFNVFVRSAPKSGAPLIVWSPAANDKCAADFATPAELHARDNRFLAHAVLLDHYRGPLFRSAVQRNFELMAGFPAARAAGPLPENVRALLGWSKDAKPFVGAYAPVE